MLCSVIIPNYNDGKSVVKAIDSVYSANREIVVIDDCSDDDSLKIIEKSFGGKISVIKNEKRLWAAAARNRGIEATTGEHIFFLDADAYLKDGSIEMLTKETMDVDIVYPLVELEDGTRMHPRNKLEEKYPRMSTAFMIKRKALDKLDEYFDEDYKYTFEDEDFFTRCELLGLTSKYIPEVVIIHSKMPTNATSKKLRRCIPNGRTKLYLFHKNRLLYYLKFKGYDLLDRERFSLNSIFKSLISNAVTADLESLLSFILSVKKTLLDLGKIQQKRDRLKVILQEKELKSSIAGSLAANRKDKG